VVQINEVVAQIGHGIAPCPTLPLFWPAVFFRLAGRLKTHWKKDACRTLAPKNRSFLGRRGVTFRISMVGGTIRRAGLVMICARSIA
jgi:hypothetical protein